MKKLWKEHWKCILGILLMAILIMIPHIFGYYKGHDTPFHLANVTALKTQISWTNLIPTAPVPFIANGFGYGTRFFYPPIPHLIASYFSLLFGSSLVGMRFTQFLTFFFSGITFYMLAIHLFKNKKIALVTSFIYMVAPYHLSDVFVRDAFSEMFIFISIPLIVLGLIHLTEDNRKKFYAYFIIGYSLAIYSHMAMSIYFTLMILITFFLLYWKKLFQKKNFIALVISAILILGITSPFTTSLFENKLSNIYTIFIPFLLVGKGDLRFSVLKIQELFAFVLPHTFDFIRFHLPLFVIILVGIGIFLFFKNKEQKDNKIKIFFLLFTVLSFIMTIGLFPWYYVPSILQTLQFPWRLALYITFGSAIIAGFGLQFFQKKKYFNKLFITCIILCCFSSWYYVHDSNILMDENNINYNLGMGNQNEYLPYNTFQNMDYFNNRKASILSDNPISIEISKNKVPDLDFKVSNLITPTKIELPRLYYLGYVLTKDNQKIPLNENENGFLEAILEENGEYQLRYKNTFIGNISGVISIVSIILFIFLLKKRIKTE